MVVINSPAEILKELLLSNSDEWDSFISSMPDSPDNCVAIYDTAGTLDGRVMKTGEVDGHYGIQIKVRSLNYEDGWQKLNEMVNNLDLATVPLEIVVGETTYIIQNGSRTSPIVPIGNDEKRRSLFTVNYLMAIKEI